MPFNRPTLPQIIDRVLTDIQNRLNTGKLLVQSFLSIIGKALAAAAHSLYGYISWGVLQLFPDTAEKEFLVRWGTIWGVPQKPADFGTAVVIFSGTNGSTILTGTVLQRADGVQYQTTADGTIGGGTATIPIIALDAGSAANMEEGTTLTLVSPVSGVVSAANVGAGGMTDGVDVEADESLRGRVLDRIQQPPHGGAAYDYPRWAKEVPGITRAFVYPGQYGLGTVGVAILQDDNETSIIPGAPLIAEVQAHIDAVRPVTADVTVWAPVAKPLDFTIQLTPGSAAVKAAVEASLRDMLRREAEPGKTILISKIREAVSVAAGEEDNSVTVPAGNFTVAANEIAVFGEITWTP